MVEGTPLLREQASKAPRRFESSHLRQNLGVLLTYLALYQQLQIEFLSDSGFDQTEARDDAYALWSRWRQTAGRHFDASRISEEFGRWWRMHYEDCLRAAECPRSYRRFMECLTGKIPG